MKKEVLLLPFLLLILCTSFLAAAEESVSDKGYACLESEVSGECASLTTEGKIFSLLAIDRCKTEVTQDSLDNKCWPESDCAIKTTAQAILALSLVGTNTKKAEDWLKSQTTSPEDVDWLLQIDSTNPTSCTISYQGKDYTILIDEDKKISGSDGSCLKGYGDDYWLEISSDCYDVEFTISCSDDTFYTSLLFKKDNSDIIYVSSDWESTSPTGTKTEKIDSLCFQQGGVCNYEGTLWAARVLKFRGKEVSSYLPYLITMAEENPKFLPEAFLYPLTNNYKDELLLKQKEDTYWLESGNKFYDTAVALFPLQNEEPVEKTNAKAWLEEVQGTDGCWQGNIIDTAFILFSAWPKKSLDDPDDPTSDCGESNYYCMSDAACAEVGGEELTDYTGCFTDVCCDTQRLFETCLAQGGEECDDDKICSEGRFADAADTTRCCVTGECEVEEPDETSACEQQEGTCKSFCADDEETSSLSCPSPDTCCVDKTKSGSVWIWILGALILLTLIGILFRKKLRKFWFKIKSKKGKGRGQGPMTRPGPRGFPPGPSSAITQRQRPRGIIPQRQRPIRRSAPVHKDLDNVLKKLKEMGK